MIKKFKKVLPVLMALIVLILPFGGLKAFAYSGGLLDGKAINVGSDISTTTTTTMSVTDNNGGSSKSIGTNGGSTSVFWYKFNSPQIITDYYLNSSGTSLKIKLYDSNKILLSETVASVSNGVKTSLVPVSNVSYVSLQNDSSSAYSVYEFDVFAPPPPTHDEIKNVISTVDKNNVTLTYDIPSSNTHFTGSKIYRDGTLIKTQSKTASSFVDSGLSWNKTYSYKITATYDDSFETAGQTTAAVVGAEPVDPSKIPPNPVSSLNVSHITPSSVQLDWANSTDTNLKSVNIYVNGTLYKNVPLGTSTTVTGLNPLTQYTFSVSLINDYGNESQRSNVVATTLDAPDTTPPDMVSGLSVTNGDSALFVSWNANKESDLDGYNVYIDGKKFNTTLIKGTFVTIGELNNGQSYSIKVSAVDKSGNESAFSTAKSGTPKGSLVPSIKTKYSLQDVAEGVSNWFGAYWLIIAFAAAIPLSFYIASRIKLMFLE